jgi:predicted lipoprotein
MKKNVLLIALTAAMISIICYACSKGGGSSDPQPENGFDKTAMLTNYADNLVIPGYTALQSRLQDLDAAVTAFLAAPADAGLQQAKTAFRNAYLQFERVSVNQYGPAETYLLGNFVNTFPADTASINASIQSGTYDLASPGAVAQQGLPALDYLLFESGALQKFTNGSGAARKKYVQDVLTRLKGLVDQTLADWKNTYRSQFIGNTRTDVGSPIGYLVNQFAYEMDQLKGPRVGWPFGKQSGGTVFADKCEAYYSGFTAALAIENLTSLRNSYTGGDAKGIDDYLVSLKKDQLNTDVLKQFDITLARLKAIPEPMSAAFTNNKDLVDAAYKEIQLLLTLLKTDVASATGVRITYQDSDGD